MNGNVSTAVIVALLIVIGFIAMRTAITPKSTISVKGPEKPKCDEDCTRLSAGSLQARIQSCSCALVSHILPFPPFTRGNTGSGCFQ